MRRVFAVVAVASALTGTARAGAVIGASTTVDLSSREASGVYLLTRLSADDRQFIGCYVSARQGSPAGVICAARDAQGVALKCRSQNPLLLKVAGSISPYSQVAFRCDDRDELVGVWVGNASLYQ